MTLWRWRESFQQDPEKAIADLFSGRAGLGAAMRLDVPEILLQEFPDLPEHAADRERLDRALLAWLDAMRGNYRREVRRLDFDVYGKRLCDALRALQLLELPLAIHHIREVHGAWLRWLTPLRLAPERDPALESWRLLSLRQDEETNPAPWLQLALDRRPGYLSTALVGLQRIPTSDQQHLQVLMVAALLHHYGQAQGNTDQKLADFKRHLAALRGRYPRGPAHWQQVLETALAGLEGHPQNVRSQELAQRLRQEQGPSRPSKANKSAPVCPTKQQKDAVMAAIQDHRQATARVADQYLDLVENCLRFAQSTGDAYFFVRTLHNHGKRLLVRPDLPATAMARIGELIEEALRWEPVNPHVWTLWADWLACQGREAHQQWVLREAVRLFPDDEPSRVELARLLIRRGKEHWPEAEHWLREVVNRHPDHEHSRVELARLLVRRGEEHWPEAERWLLEVVNRHPDNEHSRVVLAKLLTRTGRREEGMSMLREFLARNPGNTIARTLLEKLGRVTVLPSEWEQEELDMETPESPSRAGAGPVADAGGAVSGALIALRLRAGTQQGYADARFGPDESRQAALQRLSEAAGSGDALAGFYSEWLAIAPAAIAPAPNAWAWHAARCFRTKNDGEHWDAVQQRFPEHWEATRFIRWLENPDAEQGTLNSEVESRMMRRAEAQDLDVLQRFALSSWQRLTDASHPVPSEERKEIAFSLLEAEAEPSLVL